MDYSLTSLFRDEQRRIVQLILNSTLWDIETSLTTIYEDHASLLHYLSQLVCPSPRRSPWRRVLPNAGLRRALGADPIDQPLVRSLLIAAKADKVPLETATLSYLVDQRMKLVMVELQISKGSVEKADRALTLARNLTELPFELNLWQAQNIWYEILRSSKDGLTALRPEDRQRWKRHSMSWELSHYRQQEHDADWKPRRTNARRTSWSPNVDAGRAIPIAKRILWAQSLPSPLTWMRQ